MKDEIGIYKRKAEREKLARAEAEKLLEEKSFQLYTANQDLLKLNENLELIVNKRTDELNIKQKEYKAIVESISDLIYKTDLKGNITYASPVAGRITGFSDNELIGKNIFDFIPNSHYQAAISFYKKQLADKNCLSYIEIPLMTKSKGIIWMGQNIQFVDDKCNDCLTRLSVLSGEDAVFDSKECSYKETIIVARDISEQIDYQEKLLNAKQIAEEAYNVKSEFLANVSHEIRTPMNAILGFSQILLSKTEQDQYKSYLNSIISSGQSLLSLINDILDLSKIEAGKLELVNERVNYMGLINEVETIFKQSLIENNIELVINIQEGMPEYINIDALRLRQVLLNLIGNSIKFSDNGEINLNTLFKYTKDRQKIELIIEVVDNGIGISKDEQKLIFTPFYQQKGQDKYKFGGTGLGLSISKRLIEKMHGSIHLESEANRGSAFKIVLPNTQIMSNETIQKGKNQVRKAEINFEASTLLVVDDFKLNIEVIIGLLSSYPIKIFQASSGEMALKILETEKPDIILMDIRMPGLDGFETTRLIKSNISNKNIPVIAFTASSIKEKENEMLKVFDGLLRKPIIKDELLCELSRHLIQKLTDNSFSEPIKSNIETNVSFTEITNRLKVLIPKWENINETLILYEIEEFFMILLEIESLGEIKILRDYIREFKTYIDSFDINKIEHYFKLFPNKLSEIEVFIKRNQTNE